MEENYFKTKNLCAAALVTDVSKLTSENSISSFIEQFQWSLAKPQSSSITSSQK